MIRIYFVYTKKISRELDWPLYESEKYANLYTWSYQLHPAPCQKRNLYSLINDSLFSRSTSILSQRVAMCIDEANRNKPTTRNYRLYTKRL